MAFLRDIAETYGRPANVITRKLAQDVREDQLLGYLLIASLVSFVARLPALLQTEIGAVDPSRPALVGAAFVASMLFGPLFFYALAAISHRIALFFGGKGGWQGARLALFWPLMALQPLVVAVLYLNSQIGPSGLQTGLTTALALFFFWTWIKSLIAAERS